LDALDWLRQHPERHGVDVVRDIVKAFAEQLMSAEADELCGAGHHSENQVNLRTKFT
jgi:transposase-like protein